MEGNQTNVIKCSDGGIKTLMASVVPESTKRSLKYAVNVFEGGESLPCEQLVSPTPNERETTASNRSFL